jgi:hypothetical protein
LLPRKPVGGDADESNEEYELGQCQQLGDGAMSAEHQRCAELDEIAGYVSIEETLQAEKGGGVYETAGEARQSGKHVVSHHSLQWSCPRARTAGPIPAAEWPLPCAVARDARIFSMKYSRLAHEIRPGGCRPGPAFCRRLWLKRYINAVPAR